MAARKPLVLVPGGIQEVAAADTLVAATPVAGDNSTNVATTATVVNATKGLTPISTTGGISTLTPAQAAAPVILIAGALTSAASIVVPNTGNWLAANRCTGAYAVTIQTASGTGVVCATGYTVDLIADGTNVVVAGNDAAAYGFAPSSAVPVKAALPSKLTGLTLWLAADRITGAADASAVSSWADLSGSGNNATQATTANQPTYNSSRATVPLPAGNPVVTFNGTSGTLASAASASTATTIFVVARCTSYATGAPTLVGSSGAAGALLYFQNGGATLLWETDSNNPIQSLTNTADAVNFHCYAASYANPGASVLSVDGAATGGSATVTFATGMTTTLGKSSHATSYFPGQLAEVIKYSRVLFTTERQSVENYLMNKWGIPH